MSLRPFASNPLSRRILLPALGLAALLVIPVHVVTGQQGKLKMLRIGSSGSLTDGDMSAKKEKAALATLESFIKDETGLDATILRQKSWNELTDKLAKGQLELGVFQGYEFAWAQEKAPALKPLAVAVNVYRYPTVYVVARKNDAAKGFAGLQGQPLGLPATGQGYLQLFVERQAEAQGKKLEAFFPKIKSYENVEDALDDVVDGVVKATVSDRAGVEAYKRRKPGRFRQLKEVAQSPPFPPTVVAYYDSNIDDATLRRFRDGLLKAKQTEKGQTMLTFFRLTGFEEVPSDFERVLAATRKSFPAPKSAAE